MYNSRFIFEECGFDWIPAHIDRSLLFNVSYDIQSGDIKLYILNESRTALFKVSRLGIVMQHEASAAAVDPAPISEFLFGFQFSRHELVIDTVEGDTYYILIEEGDASDYVRLLDLVCLKYGMSKAHLIQRVNQINRVQVRNIFECMKLRTVSMVRLPLSSDACKIYSRPFRTGNGFDFNSTTVSFLTRLYDCPVADLEHRLRDCWISADLNSERILVTTQHDTLLYSGDATPSLALRTAH